MSALPAPPINTLPLGLLAYLGIKNGGRNPAFLAETLLPTMDLGFFYDGALRKFTTGAGVAVAAVGLSAASITVPQGEVWIPDQILAYPQAALAAGVTVTYQVQVLQGNNSIQMSDFSGSWTAGQRPVLTLDGPFLIPPGSTFNIFCNSYAGAATNFEIYFAGSQLPV